MSGKPGEGIFRRSGSPSADHRVAGRVRTYYSRREQLQEYIKALPQLRWPTHGSSFKYKPPSSTSIGELKSSISWHPPHSAYAAPQPGLRVPAYRVAPSFRCAIHVFTHRCGGLRHDICEGSTFRLRLVDGRRSHGIGAIFAFDVSLRIIAEDAYDLFSQLPFVTSNESSACSITGF